MSEVGLVLAAGAASRFGSPKQLAEFHGRPLLTWPLRTLRAAGLARVIVVLGAHAELIAPVVTEADPAAEIVLAEAWREGLSASLRTGVSAAARLGAERVLIVLGDQPLLHPDVVAGVLEHSRSSGAPIVRADYGGSPGHPVALSRATFAAVADLRGDAGARRLTGFAIAEVPSGLGSPIDIDTPADLTGPHTSG